MATTTFQQLVLNGKMPVIEPKVNDIAVLVATVVALAYPYWSHLFLKRFYVSEDFWHTVPQSTGSQAESRQQKSEERNIGSVFTQQKLDFVVFWGSQSGRAEILARQFAKSLHDRFGLRALAADLDDFDIDSLAQLSETQRVAFVLSTYGDGDPPDNTCALWSLLHGAKDTNLLSSLRYIIFGLGNSNYRQFNQVAKAVDEKLQSLSAKRLFDLGAGDDAHGNTENDFLVWRRAVQSELKTIMSLTEQTQSYQPAFTIQEDASIATDKLYQGEPWTDSHKSSQQRGTDPHAASAAQVTHVRRLWETADRLCLHLDLDLGKDRRLKYKTGDHLPIWACNSNQEVDRLLECTGLSAKRHVPLNITPNDSYGYGNMPIPSPTTLDSLFRYYVEICGSLSMDLLGALADFAPSDTAREKLNSLYEDADKFKAAVLASHMTFAGLLKTVDADATWNIPISFLLERLKPMQPRSYSIASSAVVQPKTASITVVVDKPSSATSDASGCYGLATSYLWALERSVNNQDASGATNLPSYNLDGPQGLLRGGKLLCNTVQSNFKLPAKTSSPIIMVGAGTGVAPFRAFVQERLQRKEFSQDVGRTLLFMGFRDSQTDFIYQDEWKQWQEGLTPEAFSYWTGFSRDKTLKKTYVQNLIEAQEKEIMELLEVVGCRFYICGSANMARDVVDTLVRMRVRHTGCNRDAALQWVKKLRQFQTLLEDVWG